MSATAFDVISPVDETIVRTVRFADHGELDAASAPGAAFDNSGQDCCSRSRVLVQASVYDQFMELLEPAVKDFTVGDPTDPATAMGPLISARHREKVSSYFDEGTAVAFRGTAPPGPGFWFPPTVISPVSAADRQWREEIFGPVIAVMPFEDEEDAIRLANDTQYGLSGSLWTAISGGPCGSPALGTAEIFRSTPTHRCGTGRLSADSSSRVSDASSAPTPSTRSPRPRTSSSQPRSELPWGQRGSMSGCKAR